MSEPARVAGVFLDPQRTFADIAGRPRWVVPLALTALASLIYIYAFTQRVGWERFMRQTIESSPRAAQIPPEQRERAIEMQVKFAPIGAYAGAILVPPLYGLAAAGVLLFIFNTMMGAGVSFRQAFAVMCYAGLTGLLFTLLAIVVMFLKPPDDFNLRNPLAFNPGAFLDPAKSGFLYSLASSLDLFSIWTIVLVAIGFSAAGRRLAFGKAFAGVLLAWAALILIKAGFAAAFS